MIRPFLGLVLACTTIYANAIDTPSEPIRSVICERLLTAEVAANKLRDQIWNRPFVVDFIHDMTPKGLASLGLKDLSKKDMANLIFFAQEDWPDAGAISFSLRVHRDDNFHKVSHEQMDKNTLVEWNYLKLRSNEPGPYEELASSISDRPGKGLIGYYSPEVDGTRMYLSFYSETGNVFDSSIATLGLDVPCDKVTEYIEDFAEDVYELFTPDRKYCRIPGLSFMRVQN